MGIDSGEFDNKEMNIVKNISSIEKLKIKLLGGVASTFEALYKGKEELVLEHLAGLMVTLFCISKRLGFSYRKLDQKFKEKVNNIDTLKTDHAEEIKELKQYLTLRGD